MKRVRCKSTLANTVAKNRSNLKDGKHRRAELKRIAKAAK